MFLTCSANSDISNSYHGNSFKPTEFGMLVTDAIPSKTKKVCANRTKIDDFNFSWSNVKVPEVSGSQVFLVCTTYTFDLLS